ncbi:MAG: lipoate--protein ligase family protein [Thermoleophilaceae bacterium]|nr:lipoate--protein ligase family protein [Thermoleophilaceae bacterium]
MAAGELPETIRLTRPEPMVAFGKQDAIAPGYATAVAAARERGFDAVLRLAGGRAAVFHGGTIGLAHAVPEDQPRAHIRARFQATAGVIERALDGLGVDARVGEVEGEYCPGTFSVNARGAVKLAGVGQRLVARAAHVGVVLAVEGAARVREVLGPVYDALGLAWDPDTTGEVAAEAPGATWDQVRDALLAEYAREHELVPVGVDERTLALALELVEEHRAG